MIPPSVEYSAPFVLYGAACVIPSLFDQCRNQQFLHVILFHRVIKCVRIQDDHQRFLFDREPALGNKPRFPVSFTTDDTENFSARFASQERV